MEQPISDRDAARRLARSIVSDIAMYNKERLERSIVEDNVFEALSAQIDEARSHYVSRVDEAVLSMGLFEKALVDLLIKPFGRIKSRIWQ